ncbi:MAG TPA: hypothetical protein VFY14_02690 [Streptomyces sp.]|nr:hypothetical protein [Streptomyces sp.]
MTPWAELYAAAEKLRRMTIAARHNLRTSRYYGYDEANFAAGINNACGGAAAELAALFTPDVADRLRAQFEEAAAAWPRHDPHTTTAHAAATRRSVLAMARAINGTTGDPS